MNWRDELVLLHEASFGWAMACTRFDASEADEVLQEAYLKVLDGRARYAGRAAPRTFLFGVIRRTASERRRRRRLRRALSLRLAVEPTLRPETPERALARNEQTARLVAALAALPRRQREVLHLVFHAGLSIEEAAAVAGLRLGTARTHYERGKRRLRRLLEEAE